MSHMLNLKKNSGEPDPLRPIYEAGPTPSYLPPVARPRWWRRFVSWKFLLGTLAVIGVFLVLSLLVTALAPTPWRAVFLANNQVYFGHFHDWPWSANITLTDIYYLQVGPSQLQGGGSAQPELKVVKLGSEIHGPKDKMVIPKHQILFWEDLRDDGPVGQTIINSRKK